MRNIPGVAGTYRWILAILLDQFFAAFFTKGGASKRQQIEIVVTYFRYL